MERDLMRTYAAGWGQTLLKLRLPAAWPFIFNALKINSTLALIGAIVAEFFGTPIVGELPTGAVAGLGARLLTGSYYGQTVQIWAALFMAAGVAAILVSIIGIAHAAVLKRMGARP
jgi:NitT/TauT family transport system permease protein